MSKPRFSILLPINRSPELLPFAVDSVFQQREKSFELLIVCDGAPEETFKCAKALSSKDSRVRAFKFEKGLRHGEAHRHEVLMQARGDYVAQIGDDDLWFPGYLDSLGGLLQNAHFGNLIQADISRSGDVFLHLDDLSLEATRRRMIEECYNFLGPSCAGYHLSAYKSLQNGWSPAPENIPTDLHMWRKFLVHNELVFATSFSINGVKFAASTRKDVALNERAQEIKHYSDLFCLKFNRDDFRNRAWKTNWSKTHQQCNGMMANYQQMENELFQLCQLNEQMENELSQLRQSNSWRVTRPLRKIGQLLRKSPLQKR